MKKVKENGGITLIALIITIIVMLILAGVSINAIVGNNGILSQATSATYATSIAVLQEYLQELYVENYDDAVVSATSNKAEALSKLSAYTNYFYDPSRDGDNDGEVTYGAVSYVVDSEGHALYLIKKSGLPEDIQKQLVGGDAGDGNYIDYQSLNDVYGVTSNLEVYYCSSGLSSITGIASTALDNDDINRTVTISDTGLKGLLSDYAETDGTIKASSLRSIKTLTIDSSVSSLKDLYNLTSLQELTISSATLSNLSGIENCSQLYYVYFQSSTVADYSALAKLGSKLQYLYFYDIDDTELATACSGIASAEFSNLKYLAVVGNNKYISDTTLSSISSTKSTNTITSLAPLDTLSSTTKKAVQYLSIQNNKISGDLSYIEDYTNLIFLRCEYNGIVSNGVVASDGITSLVGLEDMNNLVYLQASYNNLGIGYNESDTSIASLAKKTSLKYVYMTYNSNLAYVDALKDDMAIEYLYLAGCSKSMVVNNITTIISNCGTNYSLPVKLLTASVYKVSDYYTISSSTTIKADSELYSNIRTDLYKNTYITCLNLENVVFETNEMYQDILEYMINLEYVTLQGCSNLSSIDFVHEQISTTNGTTGVTKLIELNILDTAITDLSNLEDVVSSLKSLYINNSDIELSSIQNTISNLRLTYYWSSSYGGGFSCRNWDLWKKLETCYDITSLYSFPNYDFCGETLDLSLCTELTYVSLTTAGFQIILPSSIKTYTGTHNVFPILSENTGSIDLLRIDKNNYYTSYFYSEEQWKEFFKSLNNCQSITKLELLRIGDSGFSLDLFGYWENPSVDTLVISNNSSTYKSKCQITSLNGISYLGSNVNTLTISYIETIRDFDDIAFLSNLSTLTISNCSLGETYFLKDLVLLAKLDLRNNCIYNVVSYKDDDGNDVSYDNLEIIASLHDYSLTTVYLSGNNGITDWTPVSSINGWDSSTLSGW